MSKKNLFALVCALIFTALYWSHPTTLSSFEPFRDVTDKTRDILFKLRGSSEAFGPAKDIVVVAIDNESCQKLGLRWPWSRKTLAKLVRELHKKDAGVIAFNLTFMGEEEGADLPTLQLADAFREHGKVVTGAVIDKGRVLRPHPSIDDAIAGYGYLEKIVDEDFFIRRSYLIRPYPGAGYESSFPLKIAEIQNAPESRSPKAGEYRINYLFNDPAWQRIPAWKVVEGKISREDVAGKTVFVGLISSLFDDDDLTPLGRMAGVFIHANEYASLVAGRQLKPAPQTAAMGLSWVVSLVVLLLFVYRRYWMGVAAGICAVIGLFLLSQAFLAKDLLLEPMTLLIGPFIAIPGGIALSFAALFTENEGLKDSQTHDKMTGLYTYQYLRMRLDSEWKHCEKMNMPMSIAMTDLDRFKKINDTLGHETGNQMILKAAGVIRDSVRGYDVVSRYGGDEFVILLWHANKTEALAYRERLRTLYERMARTLDDPLLQTSSISIGVASYDPMTEADHPTTPQELVERADKDLFNDKESRRKPGEERR